MKMTDKIRNYVRLPGWLFAAAMVVYGELLLHLWTAEPFVADRLVMVMALALAFGALLALVISLFPVKAEKWIGLGVSIVLAVLYLMEYFIDDAYQVFMPLSVVAAGAQGVATNFLDTVIGLLAANLWRIALMLLPIILYGIFAGEGKTGKKIRLTLLIVCVVLYGISFGLIHGMNFAAGLTTAYEFDSAVRTYGLNVALPLDLVRSSGVVGSKPAFESPEIQPAATVPAPTEETSETETTAQATEPPVVYEQQVLPIDFGALAASETNTNISAIHSYVASQMPSMENEYTGLFEGKNLILITAEAFTAEVIDPELSPTLYRMATKGIEFTEYYQPVWGCGTTGGEFTNVVGMVPNGGDCMMETNQQSLFLTMGNQLQKLGYNSAAYHNNDYTYYSRHLTHTLLGYDKFVGAGNGLEEFLTPGWPSSDQELFDCTITEFLDQQPFSLYYMTVSGHSSYYRESNAQAKKNYHMVEDLPYSEEVKCYLAANLELENAMASLVSQLEAAGIADDTVIVIAADHYPYGLAKSTAWGTSLDFVTELFGGANGYDRFIRDHNDLIIWSSCLEDLDIVVDTPVYSLDILPTLSNLFGVEYDSRLLPGRDVFSDQEPLVFWTDYSWKTDKGTYNSTTREFTPNEGVEVEEGYVDYISTVVRNKIVYSKSVQTYDYFNAITPLLEETSNG